MSTRHAARPRLPADVLFLAGHVSLMLVLLALLRGMLLYANADLAAGIPARELLQAFLTGARFDLVVVCIVTAPLVVALLRPAGLGRRRLATLWLIAWALPLLFTGIVELEFYREFHTRLNSIAFHYLNEDSETVSSMIWHGYPVVRYLALWMLLVGVYAMLLSWLNRSLGGFSPLRRLPLSAHLSLVLMLVFLTAWGARGTLRQGPPLRWGDAFHGKHLFANHLALNGTYTLVKAALDVRADKGARWLDRMQVEKARERVRAMLVGEHDRLLAPATQAVLRRHTPVRRLDRVPRNVVVIIMESFSGAFVGALGGQAGITPEFDRLAERGLLFDRFFSNGTHTHQGMFATGACFPNLPGHEYLMQQPEGQNRFSGLPALLDGDRYNDVYVYNGHFAWDNQEGFFRNQGMTRFVGRDDMVDPVFIDPTWGVSDQDMFSRALQELDDMPADRPFYAVLQTLSNHTPFALPEDLPVAPVSGHGGLDEHLTAQRYADWALGRFFAVAETRPWFDDTLFVVVGDHAFPSGRQLSSIDLLRFRVPLLLIGAGIRETYGPLNHTVATQTDVVPTVLGLLGEPFVHQCWGRDLLSTAQADPGFGVVKPSGSDQTVALIRGDTVLVRSPDGRRELGRYRLSPAASYTRLDDPAREQALGDDLEAYVQTAMRSLRSNRTGIDAAPDRAGPEIGAR